MNKNITFIGGILALATFLVIVGFGCAASKKVETDENGEVLIDRDAILFEAKENGLIMNDDEIEQMAQVVLDQDEITLVADFEKYLDQDFSGWTSAGLADVTGGSSYGLAHATLENNVFTLVADMGGLPVLGEGYYYEGWLVKRGEDLHVLSTGRAEIFGDGYANVFQSPTDYSDYDFFVLTLEPDNNDPSPDEHILEGTLK